MLYLEDDPDAARTGLRLIGPQHDVRVARTATEALAIVKEGRLSGALLDIGLPEGWLAGLDVARAIRARSRLLPIVVLTGQLVPDVINTATLLEFHILAKPSGMEHLRVCLAKFPLGLKSYECARTRHGLTNRQVDILRWVEAGHPVHALADLLGVGEPTVKTHVSALLTKIGERSVRAAVDRIRRERGA